MKKKLLLMTMFLAMTGMASAQNALTVADFTLPQNGGTITVNLTLDEAGVYTSYQFKVVTPAGAQVPVKDAMAPMVTQLATAVPQLAPVMEGIAGVAGDVNLNCDQKGWGVTPIIGVDWRINDHWNLAAKYEFKTRMRLENESGESKSASALAQLDEYEDGKKVAADLPAILYLGAQYSPIEKVRINARRSDVGTDSRCRIRHQ